LGYSDKKSDSRVNQNEEKITDSTRDWVFETKKFIEDLIQNKNQNKQTEIQEIIMYLKNGITELEQPAYVQSKHEHSQACLDSKGKPLHSLD
jgi:hypothetical protein